MTAPKNILLLCATKAERNAFKPLFKYERITAKLPLIQLKHPSLLQQKPEYKIYILQTGIGIHSLDQLTHFMNEPIIQPEIIINYGLAGALVEALQTGQIILADAFLAHKAEPIKANPILLAQAHSSLVRAQQPFTSGNLFSSKTVLATPIEKKKIYRRFKANAVDMENYWLAQYAQQNNIPFLSIRVIFDTLNWDLSDINNSCEMTSAGDLKKVQLVKNIIANPKLIFQLPECQRALTKANESLKTFLTAFIQTLNSN